MASKTTNYELWMPDSTDNFDDFLEEFNENMETIDDNLGGGGGGSSGHTIIDENGQTMPTESKLQFTGSVSVTDDNANGRTVVNVSGGGGSGLIVNAQIYSDNEKVVGIWRDNKPLYQKTFYASSGLSSHLVFAHGIPDIDTLAKSECILRADDDSYQIPITTDQANAEFEVTPTDIEIWLNNDFLNLLGNGGYAITLWYTKTTDTAGSGGYEAYGFSPVIYSDQERKIGVWRDNKPLYQKTWDISDLFISYNSWTVSSIPIGDMETIVNVFAINQSGKAFWGDAMASLEVDPTYIGFQTGRNNNTNERYRYVTIQYTKTTDVAGSGDYNTYGVPTVHYSTNEQVIGTWIDDKPLYERVLELTQDTNLTADTWVKTEFNQTTMKALIKAVAVIGSSGAVIEALSGGFIDGKIALNSARNVGLNVADSARLIVQYTKTTD